jgi:hypothetical protein
MADLCCDSAARGARGPYSTSLHRGSSSGGAKDRRWCCGLVQPVESSSRASVRPDESSSGASNITFISISRAILFFPKKMHVSRCFRFSSIFYKNDKESTLENTRDRTFSFAPPGENQFRWQSVP